MKDTKNRVCINCDAPIWFNTFLTEWFHDDNPLCALAEPKPLTKKKSRNYRSSNA